MISLIILGFDVEQAPVLAPRPAAPDPAVGAWAGSGLACESSEFPLVSKSVCTCAGLGFALLLDPLWDFEIADFPAASPRRLGGSVDLLFRTLQSRGQSQVTAHEFQQLF